MQINSKECLALLLVLTDNNPKPAHVEYLLKNEIIENDVVKEYFKKLHKQLVERDEEEPSDDDENKTGRKQSTSKTRKTKE